MYLRYSFSTIDLYGALSLESKISLDLTLNKVNKISSISLICADKKFNSKGTDYSGVTQKLNFFVVCL
jgi:hypothetical protein